MYLTSLISFKNLSILPELFLSISILFLLLYGSIISTKKKYLIIQNSIINLGIFILFLLFLLFINDPLYVVNINQFNNTIISDSLSYFSKLFIIIFSIVCLFNIKKNLEFQKINNFEYILLYLFAILGLLLLCSSNDLITAYLSIELQSLSFYVMASFKKNSNYSVDAGLKYFVLGSLSSGLFLFGSSLIYGFTGSTNFEDFKDLFFWFTYDNYLLVNDVNTNLDSSNVVMLQSAFLLRLNQNENYKVFDNELYYFFNNVGYENSSTISVEDFIFLMQLKLSSIIKNYQELNIFSDISDYSFIQFAIVFILISMFFKLSIAPFHGWLPDVYEGSPTSSTFFFAIIPKLGLFTLLIRIFYYSFYGFMDLWIYVLIVIALLSIIVGSFTAIEQRKLKSLFAYSSIGHMGYALIAYSSGTFDGVQMLLIYLLIYMLAGAFIWSSFLLTKLKYNTSSKYSKDLGEFSLLFKSNKILALSMFFVLLSLAGFPPLIGFLAKASVFLVSIKSYLYYVAILAILCSVVSTFYYLRIMKTIFFENCLVGSLYLPIKSQNTFCLIVCFYTFIFLFINPTLLYLITYKVSLLISIF